MLIEQNFELRGIEGNAQEQPVIGVHIRPRGPGPLNLKFCSMSIPLTVANFFRKYFVA